MLREDKAFSVGGGLQAPWLQLSHVEIMLGGVFSTSHHLNRQGGLGHLSAWSVDCRQVLFRDNFAKVVLLQVS